MPPVSGPPGSAEAWLARSKADLALARAALPDGACYEDLCYHAQQAAEKSLKAVYVLHGWEFRYTHDLEELITGLKRRGLTVPNEVVEADVLSRFAWESRYPSLGEPVDEEEHREAVDQVNAVVTWAEGIITS